MALEKGMQASLVKKIREKYGSRCQVRVLHGTRFSVKGDPDIYGVVDGQMFVIELKQKGKAPADLQLRRLEGWRQAGAIAFWADDVQVALETLERELEWRA
jgi:hypothetical protein